MRVKHVIEMCYVKIEGVIKGITPAKGPYNNL